MWTVGLKIVLTPSQLERAGSWLSHYRCEPVSTTEKAEDGAGIEFVLPLVVDDESYYGLYGISPRVEAFEASFVDGVSALAASGAAVSLAVAQFVDLRNECEDKGLGFELSASAVRILAEMMAMLKFDVSFESPL